MTDGVDSGPRLNAPALITSYAAFCLSRASRQPLIASPMVCHRAQTPERRHMTPAMPERDYFSPPCISKSERLARTSLLKGLQAELEGAYGDGPLPRAALHEPTLSPDDAPTPARG